MRSALSAFRMQAAKNTYIHPVGTVDNHGNTEITETVIFVKCCECRDFAKMPCFLPKMS